MERGRTPFLALALALTVVLAAIPAVATSYRGVELLDEITREGPSYAAWEVEFVASDWPQVTNYSLFASIESDRADVTAYGFAGDDWNAIESAYKTGWNGVRFHDDDPGGTGQSISIHQPSPGTTLGNPPMTAEHATATDAVKTMVAMVGNDDPSPGEATLGLRGTENVTVLSRSSGEATLYREHDFQGTGELWTAVFVHGAKHVQDATLEISFEDRAYITFIGENDDPDELEMHLHTPDGTEIQAYGSYVRSASVVDGPPGHYVLHIVHDEGHSNQPVFALVADVEPP